MKAFQAVLSCGAVSYIVQGGLRLQVNVQCATAQMKASEQSLDVLHKTLTAICNIITDNRILTQLFEVL